MLYFILGKINFFSIEQKSKWLKRIHENIKPHLIFLSVDDYHMSNLERDLLPIIDEFQEDTHVVPCAFIGSPKLDIIRNNAYRSSLTLKKVEGSEIHLDMLVARTSTGQIDLFNLVLEVV